MNYALVSLNDVLEVRIEGLSTEELLAFLLRTCEYFITLFKTSTNKHFGGIFSPFSIFFNRNGEVVVKPESIKNVSKKFIPPELFNICTNDNDICEPQLIWCLGKVAMHSAHRDFSDADLFSLFNLLTVEGNLTSNRPTFVKLEQILQNKVQNFNSLTNALVNLYKDLMGDIDELIKDKFCDDIRFSSTRSSLSIISGALRCSNKSINSTVSSKFDTTQQLNLSLKKLYVIEDEVDDTLTLIDENEKNFIIDNEINEGVLSFASSRSTTPVLENFNFISDHNEKSIKLKEMAENLKTGCIAHKTITKEESDNKQLNNTDIEFTNFDKKQNIYNFSTEVYSENSNFNCTSVSQSNGNVVSARKRLVAVLPTQIKTTNEKKDSFKYQFEEEVKKENKANFKRQNFFQFSQKHNNNKNSFKLKSNNYKNPLISSSGSKFAIPEFLEKSTMLPIRLKAQRLKKKKITLYRQENAIVLVKLLTGQCVEVNCSTDVLVLNIFETVASHLNITEHSFFGLAILKDSEYYFLDNEKRLDKWALFCWKNSRNSLSIYSPSMSSDIATIPQSASNITSITTNFNSNTDYCLHLRFRYYPKKIEFIKTKATMHNLYLQLRQDILDGVLRFNDNSFACELAALALQAEFGDFPYNEKDKLIKIDSYYKFENYLPTNFYTTSELNTSVIGLKNEICNFHFQLKNINKIEAERMFIIYCQNSMEYGAHYYRVSKIKPSSTSARQAYFSRLSDVHQLAIMPLGITICREQTTTGVRHVQTAYEWSTIRTLQFDRKRILIATVKKDISTDHVFYTDHYSKSSYLVRFAATQHRFMIKMRHWQSTLNRLKGNDVKNVFIDSYSRPIDVNFTAKSLEKKNENNESNKIENFVNFNKINTVLSHQDLKTEKIKNILQKIDSDYIRYFYGSEAEKLSVVLEKRFDIGLGLTLVDGVINGVKGVYIKSVSEEGDGKKKGLNIGDCILSINKISLFNKSRHDAVELVKQCEKKVEIEFLRFPSITEVLASKIDFDENNLLFTNNLKQGELKRYSFNKKKTSIISTISTSPKFKKYNQRAVSDFGTIGDNLPVLNTEDLIIGTIQKRTLSLSDSEESITESSEIIQNTSSHTLRRGTYNIEVDRMYKNFHNDDENSYKIDNKSNNLKNSTERTAKLSNSFQHPNKLKDFDSISWATKSYDATTLNSCKSDLSTKQSIKLQNKTPQKNTLDWTNDLSDIDDGDNNINTKNIQKYSEILKIKIQRAFIGQPLGFQVGSAIEVINNLNDNQSLTFFVVKQITAMPAAGTNLTVGDIIRKINNKEIIGLTHDKVVELLCLESSDLNLELEVERIQLKKLKNIHKVKEYEKTIYVTLDKSKSKSIGLTLAKRMGHEGIFIRNITPGSLAAEQANEKLCIGDRIWMINGELVSNESSREIVIRLSQINDVFEICIKRKIPISC